MRLNEELKNQEYNNMKTFGKITIRMGANPTFVLNILATGTEFQDGVDHLSFGLLKQKV